LLGNNDLICVFNYFYPEVNLNDVEEISLYFLENSALRVERSAV